MGGEQAGVANARAVHEGMPVLLSGKYGIGKGKNFVVRLMSMT